MPLNSYYIVTYFDPLPKHHPNSFRHISWFYKIVFIISICIKSFHKVYKLKKTYLLSTHIRMYFDRLSKFQQPTNLFLKWENESSITLTIFKYLKTSSKELYKKIRKHFYVKLYYCFHILRKLTFLTHCLTQLPHPLPPLKQSHTPY